MEVDALATETFDSREIARRAAASSSWPQLVPSWQSQGGINYGVGKLIRLGRGQVGPPIVWMGNRLICISIYWLAKVSERGEKRMLRQQKAGNCQILILPPEISSILVVHAALQSEKAVVLIPR